MWDLGRGPSSAEPHASLAADIHLEDLVPIGGGRSSRSPLDLALLGACFDAWGDALSQAHLHDFGGAVARLQAENAALRSELEAERQAHRHTSAEAASSAAKAAAAAGAGASGEDTTDLAASQHPKSELADATDRSSSSENGLATSRALHELEEERTAHRASIDEAAKRMAALESKARAEATAAAKALVELEAERQARKADAEKLAALEKEAAQLRSEQETWFESALNSIVEQRKPTSTTSTSLLTPRSLAEGNSSNAGLSTDPGYARLLQGLLDARRERDEAKVEREQLRVQLAMLRVDASWVGGEDAQLTARDHLMTARDMLENATRQLEAHVEGRSPRLITTTTVASGDTPRGAIAEVSSSWSSNPCSPRGGYPRADYPLVSTIQNKQPLSGIGSCAPSRRGRLEVRLQRSGRAVSSSAVLGSVHSLHNYSNGKDQSNSYISNPNNNGDSHLHNSDSFGGGRAYNGNNTASTTTAATSAFFRTPYTSNHTNNNIGQSSIGGGNGHFDAHAAVPAVVAAGTSSSSTSTSNGTPLGGTLRPGAGGTNGFTFAPPTFTQLQPPQPLLQQSLSLGHDHSRPHQQHQPAPLPLQQPPLPQAPLPQPLSARSASASASASTRLGWSSSHSQGGGGSQTHSQSQSHTLGKGKAPGVKSDLAPRRSSSPIASNLPRNGTLLSSWDSSRRSNGIGAATAQAEPLADPASYTLPRPILSPSPFERAAESLRKASTMTPTPLARWP
mmetsp:Transcript_1172/g.2523  ORF Transcript_1172/g.2523 Transcript_1172/m.2523 type:complete len:738 (+) Transcript_1172:186-2399(+)